MSVKQKIGQLVQYNATVFGMFGAEITGPINKIEFTEEEVINIGSVLNFTSASEVKIIQDLHLEKDPNKIPMLFMMDVIHGYRTIYPIPLALGCTFNPKLVKKCAEVAATEATANGVHLTFAPMVDYVRDPRWGRVMESCGEDVLLNCIMAKAQIEGFRGENLADSNNLATCVKHFAAYGAAEGGRDYNEVNISEGNLREYYLPAYRAAIEAGADMIMPSFNSVNGVPSIANSWLMKKILKDEWKFDGVVISDYNALGELMPHGITSDFKEATYLAFSNNCDIDMCSQGYIHNLETLISEGKIAEEQLDNAVFRVLRLKERLGLFENPYHGLDEEKYKKIALSKAHRDVARKAAEESAVLLKNENVLPFSADIRKIAIIGPFAEEHEILGWWHCNGKNEESVTVSEGIKNLFPNAEITVVRGCTAKLTDDDTSGFVAARNAAEQADAVILCLGEPQNYSGEGNCRTDLRLPGKQEELARTVASANNNIAVVLFNGRPLVLTELEKIVPAILEMWYPGTEGGNAAANLLFGKVNPSGKLTMSFPESVGQCPVYYNHTNTGRPRWTKEKKTVSGYFSDYIDCGNLPLYSFGYGLSYSQFEYLNLTLSSEKLTKDGEITAFVRVKNTSKIAGKETVQLYVRDLVASVVRPIQQLIAFEKAEFKPYEEKTISFTIKEEMLRFYNQENQYVSEKGKFELSSGYADNLINTITFELI